MSNIWDRFDTIATPDEVNDAKSQFTPLEEGLYEMTLEELVPSENKTGLPMLKGKFRIVENNRIAFYNQMLQNLNNPNMTAVNIGEAVKFVGDLLGEEIEFTGLSAFADLVSSVPIGTKHFIFISYGKNDIERKFPKLKVVKQEVSNDDIAF